jgi:hypothetical protein
MKTVKEAQDDLEQEVNEEAVRQIESGYPKYVALERAVRIIRKRRQCKMDRLIGK